MRHDAKASPEISPRRCGGFGGAAAGRVGLREILVTGAFDLMYGPVVRCKKISTVLKMRSCINVSDLCLERTYAIRGALLSWVC